MNYSRYILIGDIHGCLDELKELLDKCKYDSSSDRVILLGDLVDRGPDSAGVIKFARNNNLESIMGNHDDKWYRWKRNTLREQSDPKFKNKMRPFIPARIAEYNKLDDADHEWLAKLPYFIRFNIGDYSCIAVHGGVQNHIPIEKQDKSIICRLGYVEKDNPSKMVMTGPGYVAPPDSAFWTDMWTGPEHVFYGHIVHSLSMARAVGLTYGLDTGCCFGGRLTAFMLYEDRIEETQVKAHKVYTSLIPQDDW